MGSLALVERGLVAVRFFVEALALAEHLADHAPQAKACFLFGRAVIETLHATSLSTRCDITEKLADSLIPRADWTDVFQI